ncbi:hypothetical protein BDR26DRAFT_850426 [Obelidium mucronatum]|nr:hypothetical protein BDR26DRAFT_850426 [Obelidium mucronatum]
MSKKGLSHSSSAFDNHVSILSGLGRDGSGTKLCMSSTSMSMTSQQHSIIKSHKDLSEITLEDDDPVVGHINFPKLSINAETRSGEHTAETVIKAVQSLHIGQLNSEYSIEDFTAIMAFGVQLHVDHPSLTPTRISSAKRHDMQSNDYMGALGGGRKSFANSYTGDDVIGEMRGRSLENNQSVYSLEEIISAFGVGIATPRSTESVVATGDNRQRFDGSPLKNRTDSITSVSSRLQTNNTLEADSVERSSSRLSVSYTPSSARSRSTIRNIDESEKLQMELPLLEREIKNRMYPVIFKAGDYIIRKHEIGNEMYFLSKGVVEVVSGDGKTVYSQINKGSFFGELGVLFNVPRTASVRALEESYCMVLTS